MSTGHVPSEFEVSSRVGSFAIRRGCRSTGTGGCWNGRFHRLVSLIRRRRSVLWRHIHTDPPDVVMREHLRFDRVVRLGVIDQELLRVLTTLSDALSIEGEPSATLVDNVCFGREVDEISLARNTLSVQDVELDLLERRRHLVLHD